MTTDVLVWMGGGDRELLSRCPTERPRFVALGGAVASTAVLAAVAAAFAAHDWLHVSQGVAIGVGAFWGLAIMNLDRWLLISTRRQSSALRTVLLAVPRVALAVVIGFVVAKPLVLRVFDNEVTARATAHRHEEHRAARERLRAGYAQIPKLEARQTSLERAILTLDSGAVLHTNPEYRAVSRQLGDLQQRSEEVRRAALCELDRTCGSRGGPRSVAYKAKHRLQLSLQGSVRAKQKQLRELRGELLRDEAANKTRADAEARAQLATVTAQLTAARARLRAEEQAEFATSQAEIGLLDRVDALGELTDESASMRSIALLLTVFILVVDMVPIVFKTLTLLGRPTLYENVQDEHDLRSFERVLAEEQQRTIAHGIDTRGIVASAKNRETHTARVIDALNAMSASAQQEVGERAIRGWVASATTAPPPVPHASAARVTHPSGLLRAVAQRRRHSPV